MPGCSTTTPHPPPAALRCIFAQMLSDLSSYRSDSAPGKRNIKREAGGKTKICTRGFVQPQASGSVPSCPRPMARSSRRDARCVQGGTKGRLPSRSLSLFTRAEHYSAPLGVAGPSRSKSPRDTTAKLLFFSLRQKGGKPTQRVPCRGACHGRPQNACARTLLACPA